jgi:RNA polymerase sigma factor (sigma-70 family)
MHWDKPVFLGVSKFDAWAGNYDRWIKQSAKRLGLGLMQYDEICVLRDFFAERIHRYNSRAGTLETYLMRLSFWGARLVRAHRNRAQVHLPVRFFERSRGEKSPGCVRIDRYTTGVTRREVAASKKMIKEINSAMGHQNTPEDEAFSAEIRQSILLAVAELPERERQIIEMRWWKIAGYMPEREDDRETYDDVGDVLGVTKQRVDQMQQRAIRRLRKKLAPVWREYVGG